MLLSVVGLWAARSAYCNMARVAMQEAKAKLGRQLEGAVKQEQELRSQLLKLDARRAQQERRLEDASAQVINQHQP